MTVYNSQTAADLAQFTEYAYALAAGAIPGTWPPPLPTTPALPTGYSLVAFAQAVDDVFCDKSPQYYGIVAQSSAANQIVVAIRGTADIMEWLIDFEVFKTAFTIPNSGQVEVGFNSVFSTMTFVDASSGANFDLLNCLEKAAAAGMQIVLEGHSLGGAIVALLAVDLAHQSAAVKANSTVYTEAAPAPGDSAFANFYNANAPQTFRIWNILDIVPSALAVFDFTQVAGNGIEIVPTPSQLESYDFLSVDCNHSLVTYQWLLDASGYSLLSSCKWPLVSADRAARLKSSALAMERRIAKA